MRIVVTGATGNVGSALLPQLLAEPQVSSVVALARRLPAEPDPRVQWHALDVAEDDLVPVLSGADVVIHLAWLLQPAHDPDEMWRVNVRGTRRVLDAVAAAGVPALVHASSVGAYSPARKAPAVSESHPTHGVSTSTYSRHKATAERMLDEFETAHPERRVVRLRPAFILQASAGSEIARYFIGPFVPQSLVRRSLLPILPDVRGLAFQAVHSSDMATAYVLVCIRPVTGAFNIAAEPVLDPVSLSAILGARTLRLPAAALRALVALTWRLRLQPADPGWVDIALGTPLLDTSRARVELGWEPVVDSAQALLEVLHGIATRQGGDSPVMRPRASGPGRVLEVVRALVPGVRGTG